MENRTTNKLTVASRLIGYLGVGLCLVAALVYFILQQLEIKAIGAFDWKYLIIIGCVAAVFAILAIILRIAGAVKARKAADAEEDNLEVLEDNLLESGENNEEVPATEAEAEAATAEEAPAEEKPAKACAVCDTLKNKLTPENKEKLVAAVKKNAPVIIAVAATATVGLLLSKVANDQKRAKIRREVLDLLR